MRVEGSSRVAGAAEQQCALAVRTQPLPARAADLEARIAEEQHGVEEALQQVSSHLAALQLKERQVAASEKHKGGFRREARRQ